MSLRRRLVLVFIAFALYAVLAASLAIYGSQWRVQLAADEFQRVSGQTTHIERLELVLTEQTLLLQSIVAGQSRASGPYAEARDKWAAGMQQLMAFASDVLSGEARSELLSATESLERTCNESLRLLDEGCTDQAATLLNDQVVAQIIPDLRRRFTDLKEALSGAQNQSARRLARDSSELLVLAAVVGGLAAVLVIAGSIFVHRWLIHPIGDLQVAARRFGGGDLAFRTKAAAHDELGELSAAMNEMAQAISLSERKQRTLFSNLRDAVVICDARGRVLECHDGDTKILGMDEAQNTGRPVLEVWPEWRPAARDWSEVIRTAAEEGRRILLHDVHLVSSASNRNGSVVDFVVYRVECAGAPCTAIVVRDTTERHRLETKLHHAQTMEAIGTMASGFAHDINNLLACVTGTLSWLAGDSHNCNHAERVQAALRACRRAAGLTKRLLHFARGVQGSPQVFVPGEIIETILNSMEPSFYADLEVTRELDQNLRVRMDQDQFAQIVLNLLRNARDAMPKGGNLRLRLESALSQHPDRQDGDQTYALLTVTDTGEGMPPEVRDRIFEPFFTTKSLTSPYGRGMGLAIVYSNIKNAGGFVQAESEAGRGTSIRVYIPAITAASEGHPSVEHSGQSPNALPPS